MDIELNVCAADAAHGIHNGTICRPGWRKKTDSAAAFAQPGYREDLVTATKGVVIAIDERFIKVGANGKILQIDGQDGVHVTAKRIDGADAVGCCRQLKP